MTAHSVISHSPASSTLVLTRPVPEAAQSILSAEAKAFVASLVAAFGDRIDTVLARRRDRQAARDSGEPLSFLGATRSLREGDWRIAEIPADVLDRRVEITGPVDRKMVINALNSGANVFMADFEDATSPTFENLVLGQQNLKDAVRGDITFVDDASGKRYALAERTATLFVRPRGLHLPERNARVAGRAIPGALFDFGLYFFHNAKALVARGTRPYFYLPKLESHEEARLWNDVLSFAERALDLPIGTARVTVLIETLPAAFEMDEILYELREHMLGLNCGRWDYIFSTIKTQREHAAWVLPDRSEISMEQPMMRAYTQLLIKTCHRRGAFAMGGMAAQIPVRGDVAKNDAAFAKVRADKLREVSDGHDGTWVAHPALVPVAKAIFDEHLRGPNQLAVARADFSANAEDLLQVPQGKRTLSGLLHNVRVGVRYLEAWLRGQGCVPLYDLMEDAATAEISRSQVWQWLRHGAEIEGERLTTPRFRMLMAEELNRLTLEHGKTSPMLGEAARLFDRLATSPELADFLTLEAYDLL